MRGQDNMRYRYIHSGGLRPSKPVSDFDLIGATKLSSYREVIRIPVDDIELEKSRDQYWSVTYDNRTIADIGYDYMVRINWEWVVRNDLKPSDADIALTPYDTMISLGYTPATRICDGKQQYSWIK